tara:strand:- start:8069 stop:8731 length:663 start_codon:yes stop_codon:yes gene_type:complete
MEWLCDDFIEVALLDKKSKYGYWDNPRANLRLFSSFWVAVRVAFVLVITPAIVVINQSPEVFITKKTDLFGFLFAFILGFLGFWFGLYWKEKVSIHKKWEYLANLYNDVLKEAPLRDPKSYNKRKLLEVGLALDILKMEMWGHSSYNDFFNSVLKEAVKYSFLPVTKGLYYKDQFEAYGITKKRATHILDRYHRLVRENLVDWEWADKALSRVKFKIVDG